MVVSDEEDCSIEDPALFSTPEWDIQSPNFNTACEIPASNEDYLFDVAHFRDKLIEIKGGRESAVVFAAIVGVPNGEGSPCQGTGDEISGCLDDPDMEYVLTEFTYIDDNGGTGTYSHFRPACERKDGDTTVTSARPGRRYVKLAQEFGCAGYVYSICNDDWSEAMREIARIIAKCIVVVV